MPFLFGQARPLDDLARLADAASMKLPPKDYVDDLELFALRRFEDAKAAGDEHEMRATALAASTAFAASMAIQLVALVPKAIACLSETKCCCGRPGECVADELEKFIHEIS